MEPELPRSSLHEAEVGGPDVDLDELRAALGSDFDVRRLVGEGTMARVYQAVDSALRMPVAIKVLRRGKAADETARRRFEREARAAASLAEHPNTVAVTRFGRLPDETPYIVMQYVKGRTMEERLAAEGHLPRDEAVQVLREVASALSLAHERGIVHRDVRPANVLWDEERRCARLTDFGIAAVISATGGETTRLTRTGQLLGNPRYLSPEQLEDRDLTELADMYLFGVLGYELLTGEGPYEAANTAQHITAHLKQEPRDLMAMRPDVPAPVAGLLKRCLAKKPTHRPSARDALRALEAPGVLSAGEASAPAPDALDPATLLRKRLPQIVVTTSLAGGGVLGLADMLVDREVLPDPAFTLTLVFVVAAILASAVVAWFHGERGRQRAPALEYVLLASIAVVWLAVSVMLL